MEELGKKALNNKGSTKKRQWYVRLPYASDRVRAPVIQKLGKWQAGFKCQGNYTDSFGHCGIFQGKVIKGGCKKGNLDDSNGVP